MQIDKEKIRTGFPYFSVIQTSDETEYIGIILSHNKSIMSFIDVSLINSKPEFTKLIELCQQWWWYSNRLIPINLYYHDDMKPYMQYVVHVSSKTSTVLFGHSTSLETVVEINKNSRKNRTLKIID